MGELLKGKVIVVTGGNKGLGRAMAVARRLLRNEDDARDAVQDAFLQVFRSIESFRGDANISTWLHRVVVNAALMKLRSRGFRSRRWS